MQRLLAPVTPLDWVWVVVVALVACGLLTGMVYGVKTVAEKEHIHIHLGRHEMIKKAGLDPRQFQLKTQLVYYIRGAMKSGYKRQDIVNMLMQHKWPPKMIDDAFASIERRSRLGINSNVVQRVVQQKPGVMRRVVQQTTRKAQ